MLSQGTAISGITTLKCEQPSRSFERSSSSLIVRGSLETQTHPTPPIWDVRVPVGFSFRAPQFYCFTRGGAAANDQPQVLQGTQPLCWPKPITVGAVAVLDLALNWNAGRIIRDTLGDQQRNPPRALPATKVRRLLSA